MILGLAGKKRNGKDTVCSIIQYLTRTKHNSWNNVSFDDYLKLLNDYDSYIHKGTDAGWSMFPKWKRKRFEGKLKEIVALLIGCSLSDLEDEEFKNRPLSEEWRRYYWYHYKFSNSENLKGKIGEYHTTKEEAFVELKKLDYSIWNKLLSQAELKSEIVTPRIILQELGTEGLRGIHPSIHVNALFSEYKGTQYTSIDNCPRQGIYDVTEKDELVYGEIKTKFPDWIITDVRFPNEAQAIKQREGIVIRVINPRIKSEDNHASETSLDNHSFDYELLNDGSIEDLVSKVKDMLTHFKVI